MTAPAGYRLERAIVARSFDRASRGYDAAARLQRIVREELLSRLDGVTIAPAAILDLGAGTGVASAALKQRWRKAQVVACDIAPGMLLEARRHSRFWRPLHCVAADAVRLPFAPQSFDLVFSSLMFQWCDDPALAFAEVQRVLRPGGLLLFSSFGPGTLRELRAAWATVDDGTHVNQFIDMHDLGAALQRVGFAEPVLDVDRHVLHYTAPQALLRELKAIGAHNVNSGRSRTLTGPRRFAAMLTAYEAQRTPRGLPATYEVVYGAAWATAQGGSLHGAEGETRVSLESLRKSLHERRQ
ncbi:MAG: malonyl-ACP O-methyltransferase BioC [Pseudomonadota bacterium]